MAIFTLKRGDTRPILEVALKNPDGSAHDLTGSTAWKLHIYVTSTNVVTRDLVKQGPDANGVLRYVWVDADWGSAVDQIPSTGSEIREYRMEYEVFGGSSRMTFPNSSFDTLRIRKDLA